MWKAAALMFVLSSGADMRTTDLALERPGLREGNPILGSHPSDARLYGTGAIFMGTTLWAAHELHKHGRPKTAVGILIGGALLHSWAATHNHKLTAEAE